MVASPPMRRFTPALILRGPRGRPHPQLLAQPHAARRWRGRPEPRRRDEARPRPRGRPPGRVPGAPRRRQVAGRGGDGDDQADRREPGQHARASPSRSSRPRAPTGSWSSFPASPTRIPSASSSARPGASTSCPCRPSATAPGSAPGPNAATQGQPLPTEEMALFSGDQVDQAFASQDSNGARAVGFQLKSEGRAALRRLHHGERRQLLRHRARRERRLRAGHPERDHRWQRDHHRAARAASRRPR